MIPLILATLTVLKQSTAVIIVKSSLSDYVTSFEEKFTFVTQGDQMLSGLYSYHDDGKEDRRWKFWTGSAEGLSCSHKAWTDWVNDWDKPVSFKCGPQQVLSGISSYHHDGKEDRRWRFRCCEIYKNVQVVSSRLTDFLNDWNDVLDFRCGASEVLSGLESVHHNGPEDRRWKARCVALADDKILLLKQNGLTDYVNNWDGPIMHELDALGVYSGLYSFHNKAKGDRRFKVHRVKLLNGLKCTNATWSGYQNYWDGVLSYKCGGNSAVCGLRSRHKNSAEDRRFDIKCCDLSNNGRYGISNIYQTGYVNEYDAKIDFKCGYMEVLVGLYSHHDNIKKDRRFKFYCGRLAPVVNPNLTCTKEEGFCVKKDGSDQNTGVKKLNALNGNTLKAQNDCLKLCLSTPGLTGCEVIWDQGNKGCYSHTLPVFGGNGDTGHICWVCK